MLFNTHSIRHSVKLTKSATFILISALATPSLAAESESFPPPSEMSNSAKPAARNSRGECCEPNALHVSVFVDPLGFALFGPTLGVELGKDHWAGSAYGRWLDGGALARAMFPNSEENFAFSYGAALRGRYYLDPDLAGLHFGAGAELLWSTIENPGYQVVSKSTYLVPFGEVGYRLQFGRFYGGAAAALGYAIELSRGLENMPGGTRADELVTTDRSTVYGSASLELGLFFF